MEGTIRIAGTVGESIVDGPGFRYSCSCRAVRTFVPAATIRRRTTFDGGQDIALDTLLKDMCKPVR